MTTTYNELTEKPAGSGTAPQVEVSERPKVEEISEEEYEKEKNNEKKKEGNKKDNKKSSANNEKEEDLNNID